MLSLGGKFLPLKTGLPASHSGGSPSAASRAARNVCQIQRDSDKKNIEAK
jgi:hypothetical protein